MYNNLKTYALSPSRGSLFGLEMDRVNALSGRRTSDFLTPATGELAKWSSFAEGMSLTAAKMREALKSVKLYVLEQNGQFHVLLMHENTFEMIRRPDVRVLQSVSIAQAISELNYYTPPNVQNNRPYVSQWLIHSDVTAEIITLAETLSVFLQSEPDALGPTQPKPDLLMNLHILENTVGDALSYSESSPLRTLCALSLQLAAVRGGNFWPLNNRQAWDMLIGEGNNQRPINDMLLRLRGIKAKVNQISAQLL